MPMQKVNDVELYYEIHGTGEPVVFLAGLASDHTTWQYVVPFFAEHYQVILLDNRGAGQSSVPQYPYTIDMMADDTAQLCQALNVSQANFIGNSMGGKIVQNLGFRHPELCKKLVISNSFYKINSNFLLFAKARIELIKANAPVQPLIEILLPWIFSADFLAKNNNLAKIIELNLKNPYPMTLAGYLNQLASADDMDTREFLPHIQVPCLLLASDQDIVAPTQDIKAMQTLIPQTDYHCFNTCGHLPHFEQPETYAKTVMAFLKD